MPYQDFLTPALSQFANYLAQSNQMNLAKKKKEEGMKFSSELLSEFNRKAHANSKELIAHYNNIIQRGYETGNEEVVQSIHNSLPQMYQQKAQSMASDEEAQAYRLLNNQLTKEKFYGIKEGDEEFKVNGEYFIRALEKQYAGLDERAKQRAIHEVIANTKPLVEDISMSLDDKLNVVGRKAWINEQGRAFGTESYGSIKYDKNNVLTFQTEDEQGNPKSYAIDNVSAIQKFNLIQKEKRDEVKLQHQMMIADENLKISRAHLAMSSNRGEGGNFGKTAGERKMYYATNPKTNKTQAFRLDSKGAPVWLDDNYKPIDGDYVPTEIAQKSMTVEKSYKQSKAEFDNAKDLASTSVAMNFEDDDNVRNQIYEYAKKITGNSKLPKDGIFELDKDGNKVISHSLLKQMASEAYEKGSVNGVKLSPSTIEDLKIYYSAENSWNRSKQNSSLEERTGNSAVSEAVNKILNSKKASSILNNLQK